MNDKLLMTNYLMILKSTIEVYVHGTIESSNNSVREVLHDLLNDTLNCQARTYDKMVECDWYVVDNINPKQIEKIFCTLNKDN